jgi:hypothetical protein
VVLTAACSRVVLTAACSRAVLTARPAASLAARSAARLMSLARRLLEYVRPYMTPLEML